MFRDTGKVCCLVRVIRLNEILKNFSFPAGDISQKSPCKAPFCSMLLLGWLSHWIDAFHAPAFLLSFFVRGTLQDIQDLA